MFRDLLDSILTPSAPAHRHLGYLSEAIEMRGRARRNASAWRSHLERSRAFMLSSADRCAEKDRIVILGSGLLLDVPLAELASMFREVLLMDVVCLPEIRREIGAYKNARFIECDVTGIADALYRSGGNGITELPEPSAVLPMEIGESSCVVSLNILSQLWVMPRAYISRRLRGPDEYAVDEWCGKIVSAHYGALRSLSCDVCLVADHEYVKRDRNGEVISRGSSIYGLELPVPDESWTWNIAPHDGTSGSISKELTVGAWFWEGL